MCLRSDKDLPLRTSHKFFGGRGQDVRTCRHLDMWTSGRLNVRTTRRPDIRTSRNQDIRTSRPRTSERANVQTSCCPNVRPSEHPDNRTSGSTLTSLYGATSTSFAIFRMGRGSRRDSMQRAHRRIAIQAVANAEPTAPPTTSLGMAITTSAWPSPRCSRRPTGAHISSRAESWC